MLSRTSPPLVLIDVTRLIGGAHRPIPTGIERVENAYAQWLMREPSVEAKFVLTSTNGVRLLDDGYARPFLAKQNELWREGAGADGATHALERINRFLRSRPDAPGSAPGGLNRPAHQSPGHPSRQRPQRVIRPLLQRVLAEWVHRPVGSLLKAQDPGRPILYLRTSPDRMDSVRPFETMRRFANVGVISFCHDLIPMMFPHYVRDGAAASFRRRIDVMAEISDGIVVSTDHVASSLGRHVPTLRAPVVTAPIGVDRSAGGALEAATDAPYFLVVSTIEARKNHVMLLQVWRRFVEELGPRAPKLVIIGKRGWEAHASLAMLDRTEELRPFVYEAGPVPSATLAALRAGARALLMPSHVEGFGLPVAEALAEGTPVIASDIAAFREIAGGVADLVDPLDGPAWARTILDYLDDATGRRAQALARAKGYQPPTWDQHFATVRGFMDEVMVQRCAMAPRFASASRTERRRLADARGIELSGPLRG